MSSPLVSNLVNKNKKTFKPNVSKAVSKKRLRDSYNVDTTERPTKRQELASNEISQLSISPSSANVTKQQLNGSMSTTQPTSSKYVDFTAQTLVTTTRSRKKSAESQSILDLNQPLLKKKNRASQAAVATPASSPKSIGPSLSPEAEVVEISDDEEDERITPQKLALSILSRQQAQSNSASSFNTPPFSQLNTPTTAINQATSLPVTSVTNNAQASSSSIAEHQTVPATEINATTSLVDNAVGNTTTTNNQASSSSKSRGFKPQKYTSLLLKKGLSNVNKKDKDKQRDISIPDQPQPDRKQKDETAPHRSSPPEYSVVEITNNYGTALPPPSSLTSGPNDNKKKIKSATAIITPSSSQPVAYYSLLTQQPVKPVNTTKRAEYDPNAPPPVPYLWPTSKSSSFTEQDLHRLTKEYFAKKLAAAAATGTNSSNTNTAATADVNSSGITTTVPAATEDILSDEEGLKAYIAQEYNKSHTIPEDERSYYDEVEGFRWVSKFNEEQRKKQEQQQKERSLDSTAKKKLSLPSTRWSKEDTEKLYEWIKICGTDFDMISRVMEGKLERDIKTKFNHEEKRHKKKINALLYNIEGMPDIEKWEKAANMSYEEYTASKMQK